MFVGRKNIVCIEINLSEDKSVFPQLISLQPKIVTNSVGLNRWDFQIASWRCGSPEVLFFAAGEGEAGREN